MSKMAMEVEVDAGGSSRDTSEVSEKDELEAEKEQNEILRAKLKRAQSVLKSAGFDVKDDDTGDQDREYAKKLKRIGMWCDRRGGVEELERTLRFSDKRLKADYTNVILGNLHIAPNDVVMVSWGYPRGCLSFGVVLAEPEKAAPMEVHLKLLLKPHTYACVQPRSNLITLFSPRMLNDHCDKVFDVSNLRALHGMCKNEGEGLRDFVDRFWRDSFAGLAAAHTEIRPRLTNFRKAWDEKNTSLDAAAGGTSAAALAPAPPAEQPGTDLARTAAAYARIARVLDIEPNSLRVIGAKYAGLAKELQGLLHGSAVVEPGVVAVAPDKTRRAREIVKKYNDRYDADRAKERLAEAGPSGA